SDRVTEPKGSAEQALIDARRAKAQRLRERGENPFANDVVPRAGGKTLDIAEARALAASAKDDAGKYAEDKVKAAAHGSVLHVRGLPKALRPPPEKWHGLQDVETRYRQRYVDLVANPPVAEVFRARSIVVRATRHVLDEAGFLEVETPTLNTLVGGAVARPFE